MQLYKAPLNDYAFLIKDFLNLSSTHLILKHSDLNTEDLEMILEEAAKLCENTLLPLNQSGDEEGCILKDGQVITPKGFKEAYKSFCRKWLAGNYCK